MVATTDEAFTGVTSRGRIARLVRLRIVPFLVPTLFAFRAMRRFMFRTVSQTAVNYRGSSLSEGRAGTVHGGDRLPWVTTDLNGVGTDNFTPLTSLDWQVHVYGDAAPEIADALRGAKTAASRLSLAAGDGRHRSARNAVYLVRPDGYIALANPQEISEPLTSYLDARKLFPARESF